MTETAADGDSVARAIIERGVEELATMVATVAAKLDLTSAMQPRSRGRDGRTNKRRRSVHGAVWSNAIRRRVPQAVVVEPKLPPVLGAVMLALELAAIPVSTDVIGRLIEGHTAEQPACSAT